MPSTLTGSVRDAYAAFPTGLTLVAAHVGGQDEAMLVNSFASLSLDPPLVTMSFTHTSTTWARLRHAQELGISILGEPQRDLVAQLRRAAPERLAGVALHHASAQARTVPAAAATFVVRPHRTITAGDHHLVLFEVLAHERRPDTAPLTYFDRSVGVLRRS